jgi:hypothetical protein
MNGGPLLVVDETVIRVDGVIYHSHSEWHEEAPSKGALGGSPRRGQRQ